MFTRRTSNVAACEVPRTLTSLGDRSFTVAGPRLWNNLPLHLRGPKFKVTLHEQVRYRGTLQYSKLQSVTQLD